MWPIQAAATWTINLTLPNCLRPCLVPSPSPASPLLLQATCKGGPCPSTPAAGHMHRQTQPLHSCCRPHAQADSAPPLLLQATCTGRPCSSHCVASVNSPLCRSWIYKIRFVLDLLKYHIQPAANSFKSILGPIHWVKANLQAGQWS